MTLRNLKGQQFSHLKTSRASKIDPKSPPLGWQRFNAHIVMPEETHAAVTEVISSELRRLLDSEGLAAFAMPRSAALAHEVGHCIVGTVEGLTIVKTEISERLPGIWCGVTNETSSWLIENDTPTTTVLAPARYLIGGIAGEAVLDPDHRCSGSSLDEVALSQMLCAGLWQEHRAEFVDVDDPAKLWRAQWYRTCRIIKRNEDIGRDLIRKLERKGNLYGKPLAASLRRVVS